MNAADVYTILPRGKKDFYKKWGDGTRIEMNKSRLDKFSTAIKIENGAYNNKMLYIILNKPQQQLPLVEMYTDILYYLKVDSWLINTHMTR